MSSHMLSSFLILLKKKKKRRKKLPPSFFLKHFLFISMLYMIKALFPDSQTHPPSLLNLIIPQERIQGPFSFYSPTLVNPLKDHSFNSHLGEVKWVI